LENSEEIRNFLSNFSINTYKLIENDFDNLYNKIISKQIMLNCEEIEEMISWYEFREEYEKCEILKMKIKNEN
jgi:hypothetical protein